MILNVKYDIPLTGFIMFSLCEDDLKEVLFNLSIGDHSVKILPLIDKDCGFRGVDDQQTSYGANALTVIVTKEVDCDIDGITWHIVEEFEDAAEISVNRLIRYFKYRLNTPLLTEINAHDDFWSNSPILLDENNNIIKAKIASSCNYSRHFAYGYFPRFGMQSLRNLVDPELNNALNNTVPIKLHEEFLCSARTEIIQGNFKRAVLEMAISCEIFVKSILFSGNPISGAIFDFLSSNRKIEVSIQELLHKPIKEALCASFKDEYTIHWKNIGYIFQARNKVAHSGICEFIDDKNNKIEVDEEVIEIWWESIQILIDWLSQKIH
jgi:hypothetical protein